MGTMYASSRKKKTKECEFLLEPPNSHTLHAPSPTVVLVEYLLTENEGGCIGGEVNRTLRRRAS